MVNAFRSFSLACALALCGCAHMPANDADCIQAPASQGQLNLAVDAFYDSLRNDDRGAYQRATLPSFVSFDVGKRYDGEELFDAIVDLHTQGVEIEWMIGPLTQNMRCDVAWAHWENRGTVRSAGKTEQVRWLESAVFRYVDGQWRMEFFHSQRASQ